MRLFISAAPGTGWLFLTATLVATAKPARTWVILANIVTCVVDSHAYLGVSQLPINGVPTIMRALAISQQYATDIRAGKRVPHPRHWQMLARIVGTAEV